ncbi:hypothetical protein AXG93_3309s1200 [Marchantia polymorpha subsp. ruderalis]|uniref:Uncharacterized protein n=1 Tax=Marchantia polymorpha subsp. ruderalis TaxID=1480154 RepID=A0A176W5L4_MARPO|nr:hypothetical protein AXG93_3309s1200 [Marchantia polymorpha subsp. ruderalis]
MGLLTTSEEKRFPKEKEVLELESDEESEEQDTQAEDIKRGAVRGLIRMEVVTTEEVSERRSTKRQKPIRDLRRQLAVGQRRLAVAFPNFLEDSVVPLLKYLDGKREKYSVSAETRFYAEMLRNSKREAAVKTAEEMTRECAASTTSLKVREEQLRAKKMECEVL